MSRLAAARLSVLGVGLAMTVLPLASFASEKKEKGPSPVASVREALQREIYGDAEDRQKLLSAASAEMPEYPPARWHQGYLKDGRRGWLKHNDVLIGSKAQARLAEYEKARESALDTVEGQLRLADWCAENELAAQERAHLNRVIDLAADHPVARERLGFVRMNGEWVNREEIVRDQERQRTERAAIAKWRVKVAEIRQGLEHKNQSRREYALGQLEKLTDAEAIPAIEQVFIGASDDTILPVVQAIGRIEHADAAASLTRFAVYWPTEPVREAAAKELRSREMDTYVPQIISSLYSPVVSRFVALELPDGRIGYRHAFAREGQDRHELMLMDTEYRRVALPGGSRTDSALRALADAATTVLEREQAAARQNAFTEAFNQRLIKVLEIATKEPLAAVPEAWWKWWNDRNEVFMSEKGISTIQTSRQVTIVDRVPEGSALSGSGSGSSSGAQTADCLAAGTLVWTIKGPVEVQQIRVGDMVLAQHPESGELAYKPVLRTTIRPSGKLMKIEAGGETFETSGGHLFWVSGEGWKKSRQLASGQVLHTVDGLVHVTMVESGSEAETYNLHVADFNTYFIGESKILSHDNTVRRPTTAIVPGLKP